MAGSVPVLWIKGNKKEQGEVKQAYLIIWSLKILLCYGLLSDDTKAQE